MKAIWIILLCVLMSAGCYGSPANQNADKREAIAATSAVDQDEGDIISISLDETVNYDDLEIRWLEMMDSRCPTGVQCVWAGEVKVILEATEGGNEPVELQLTWQVRRGSTKATVGGYEMELMDVKPFPSQKVKPHRSDHVAEIKITRAEQ